MRLVTNPTELKKLYLDTFKFRLRHRPIKPGYENLLKSQENLFNEKLKCAGNNKTSPWSMMMLEKVLNSLKKGKYRVGDNLKMSFLMLLNKIKDTGVIPNFMKVVDINAIYKGKGERTNIESERGIFIVSILPTILMKIIYNDKYEIIENFMSEQE